MSWWFGEFGEFDEFGEFGEFNEFNALFLQEKVQREGVSILKWQRGAKGAGFYSILGGLVS